MGIQLNGTSGTDVISAVDGSLTIDGDISVADKIIHNGDTNTAIRFPSADTITAETAGDERFRIKSDGVVNIGDRSDNTWIDSTLKVRKDQNAVTKIAVRNENSGSSASSAIAVNAYGNSWMFDCGSAAKNSNALTIRVDATAGGNQGTEKLRITTAGNVGINSTIPRSKLHVANGSSHYNPGNPTGLGAGAVACLESSGDVALQFLSSTTTDNFIYFGDTSSATTGSIQYDHSADALLFNVNGGTERFRINSVGKVGINSTAPDGMLAIEHTSSAPNLTMRNHPAAGPYTNLYGMELRHAFGSVQHGALIHTEEADLGRRSLDISDSDGVFCTFVMGRVGINTTRPTGNLDIRAKTDDNPSLRLYRQSGGGDVGSVAFASNTGTNCYINWRGGGVTKGLQFFTSSNGNDGSTAERMRLNEDLNILDGNLVIGTAGHGIDFSAQTATSAAGTGNLAELLDHYEEGSCTMNYSPASGAFGGMVYTSGKYTRIGRLVTVTGAISLHSNTNASGAVRITGWPFTVTGLNSTWSLEGGHGTLRGEYNYPDEFNMIVMNNGGTNAYVYNDSGTELNVSNMNTGYNESQCSFTVTYMTDD